MTLRKFLGFPVPCSPNFVWFLATWGIWSFPGQGSDLNLSYDLRQPQQSGILCQAGDRTCVPALERHHWIYWATVETSISQFLKRCRRRSLKINLAKKPSASLPKQFHITSPQLNLSFQGHTAFFSTSFPLLLKVAHFFPSGVNRPDLIQSVPPSKKKTPNQTHIHKFYCWLYSVKFQGTEWLFVSLNLFCSQMSDLRKKDGIFIRRRPVVSHVCPDLDAFPAPFSNQEPPNSSASVFFDCCTEVSRRRCFY